VERYFAEKRFALHLNMKMNPFLLLPISLIIASCFSACQQKSMQADATEYKPQPRMVLFMTLKVVKSENDMQTELIEQIVREDYNNPLSTGAAEEGDRFRLQILNKKGDVILTSLQQFEFKYQTEAGNPYAFLKFSESLPDGYYECIVSAERSDGFWQQLYDVKLK
jgi:hypothetical protein